MTIRLFRARKIPIEFTTLELVAAGYRSVRVDPVAVAERHTVVFLTDLYLLRDRAASMGMEQTRRQLCLLIEDVHAGRTSS